MTNLCENTPSSTDGLSQKIYCDDDLSNYKTQHFDGSDCSGGSKTYTSSKNETECITSCDTVDVIYRYNEYDCALKWDSTVIEKCTLIGPNRYIANLGWIIAIPILLIMFILKYREKCPGCSCLRRKRPRTKRRRHMKVVKANQGKDVGMDYVQLGDFNETVS